MSNKICLAILSILLLLLATACVNEQTATGKVVEPITQENRTFDVTIGYNTLRISLPIFVAVEKGFFSEAGLNVKLERFDTAQPMMQALVAGTIDMAGYTALPITYTSMQRSGKELYFITAMIEDQSHPVSYLLVNKNSLISSISGLEGKTIGVLPTVAYQKWIEVILKENNISLNDVTIMPIDPTLQATSLASGHIDALFTNDPVATTVVMKGIAKRLVDGAVVPKHVSDPMIFASFNIEKDYADKNPEIAKKVVMAIDKAVRFVDENQSESKRIMASYITEQQKPFVDSYADAKYLTTSDVSSEIFSADARKDLELGIISQKVDLEGLVWRG